MENGEVKVGMRVTTSSDPTAPVCYVDAHLGKRVHLLHYGDSGEKDEGWADTVDLRRPTPEQLKNSGIPEVTEADVDRLFQKSLS